MYFVHNVTLARARRIAPLVPLYATRAIDALQLARSVNSDDPLTAMASVDTLVRYITRLTGTCDALAAYDVYDGVGYLSRERYSRVLGWVSHLDEIPHAWLYDCVRGNVINSLPGQIHALVREISPLVVAYGVQR